MKPEILVLGSIASQSVMEQLEAQFHCHHAWRIEASEQSSFIQNVAAGVQGVVTTGSIGISAPLVAMLPRLEIVAVNGIGVDAVEFEATRPRAIHVTNTPGVLTDDVADMAVTLLLSSARRLPKLDRHVRSGAWEKRVPIAPARSIRGKVAGIFGFGRIGQAIAHRLQIFGMELRYYQPRAIADAKVARADSLLALAAESDYLVVCAPGGSATHHVINLEVLQALGPEGTLVNIARGSLVDEDALIAALQNGQLGAAALDVFAHEPSVPQALKTMDNVVLTPHVGSLTVETRQAMGQLVVDNLIAHFSGKPLLTPVN